MHGLRHRFNLFCRLLLGVLFLVGCVGPGKKLEPPRITLTNIQVQEIKVFESVFQIDLRVVNPNDVAIDIKGLDCNLELNDKHFASGVSNKRIKVSSFDTAIIPITVYSSVFDLAKGLLDAGKKQMMNYKLTGRLHLGGGLSVPAVIPFKSEGELSLPGPTST
ncbi:MAG: LEA type 2 family protein [Syntrophobacterales bacterium]|jgi:LEA14-like dessication related protein